METKEHRTQEEILEGIAQQMDCTVDDKFSEEIYPYKTYSDWAQAFLMEHLLQDDRIRRISVLIEDGRIKKMRILCASYPGILYSMRNAHNLNELFDITRIPDEIGDLTDLQHLDICTVGIRFSESIWRLPRLTKLNIFCPNWEGVTGWSGNMASLKELSLVNTFGRYQIYRLRELEKLDLGNSDPGELPDNYFNENRKLQEVNLAGTALKHLPQSLFKLKKLQHLNLEAVPIEELSPKIRELKELRSLLLKGTEIKTLPEEVTACTDLEEISFPTKLIELPLRIGSLSSLTELNLRTTELRQLPESVGRLQRLYRLTVPGTLESLPDSIGNLQNIQALDLRHTRIERLPESLGDMVNMRTLLFPKGLKFLPETIGNLKGLSYLDLKRTEIERIPESVGQMSQLAGITFPDTLCELPESIGGLQGVREMDLSKTKIRELPKGIGSLTGLIRLIFPPGLEVLPDTIGGLKRLCGLLLEDTRLKELPESIGELEQIERLTVPGCLRSLPHSIGRLRRITKLDLRRTEMPVLPEEICGLEGLESLDLPAGLEKLPGNIGQLTKIECLDLRKTKVACLPESIGLMSGLKKIQVAPALEQLPEGIGRLKKIHQLDLSNTQIRQLPNDISEMSGLKSLLLMKTRIQRLPEIMKGWKNLKVLNLTGSSLAFLPEEIGVLESLEYLHLGGTGIRTLPASVGKLKNLKELTLDGTRIEILPEEICSLKRLQRLSLSKSRVKALPSAIGELSGLVQLDISETQIDYIPDSVEKFISTEFQQLWMQGIKLDYVSKGLAKLILKTSRHGFFYSDTASLSREQIINQEPTLFECSRDVIDSFYADELVRLNECKVIFLGDGNVGKSSLIDRIIGDSFQINRSVTNGISIRKWQTAIDGKEVRVRFWDFGGQEIMHTMHLCFLTARTAYVIVLDSRQDQYLEKLAIDWLQTVKTFAPNSPVILALNKCDMNPMAMLNLASLKESFPQLVDCVRTSAFDGTNIDSLKKLIAYSIKNHSSYSVIFNKKWFRLKEELESMNAFYISNREYVSMCLEHGITDTKLQASLLRWFGDLGVSYHYSDFDFMSEPDEINVLNPEWVTNGIYRLILRTRTHNGRISHEAIYKVMEHSYEDDISPEFLYTRREVKFILEIMRQKGLSLALGQEELIPMKLDNSPPPAVGMINRKAKNILHFAIKGDYLPNSIIHKLIIGRIQEVDFKNIWRNGASLYNRDMQAKALVELRYDSRYRLDIYILSKERSVEKEYLNIIRDNLLNIITELNLDNYEEVICYQLENGISGEEPYSRVWKPYLKGIQKIYLPDSDTYIAPGILLNEIYTKEQINERGRREQGMSSTFNNYGNIYGSNISIGDNNQLTVQDSVYKAKMEQAKQMEAISERSYEKLIGLLEKMIEQQGLPVKKHLELVEILHSKGSRESVWTKIRDFLTDTANIATIATAFPVIAQEIAKLF